MDMIEPGGIPQYTGDFGTLSKAVTELRKHAIGIRNAGQDVHSRFQATAAFYKAPEADQLLSSTQPVMDTADEFAGHIESLADALDTFVAEAKPYADRLKHLKEKAIAFVDSVEGDDGWTKDQHKVDEHNALMHGVAEAVVGFQKAEHNAAVKIGAISPALCRPVGDEGGTYGISVDKLESVPDLPWGSPVARTYDRWSMDWWGHGIKSWAWDGLVKDSLWGGFVGLGTFEDNLLGVNGSDAQHQTWDGLRRTVVGAYAYGMDAVGEGDHLSDWQRGSEAYAKEFGKQFIAYDEWHKDPARAHAVTSFNILTLVGGAGGALARLGKGARFVEAAGTVAKVGGALDPISGAARAARALSDLPKVSEVLTNVSEHLRLPKTRFPNGALDDLSNRYRVDRDGQLIPINADGTPNLAEASHEPAAGDRGGEVPSSHATSDSSHGATDASAHPNRSYELVGTGARAEHTTGSTHTGEQAPGAAGRSDGGHVASHEGSPSRTAGTESFDRSAPGGGRTGHAFPGAGHGDGTHDPAHGRPNDLGAAEDLPGQRSDDVHPAGTGWYKNLDPHQIKDVQVYRANHEPGYFDKYYRSNGRRLRVFITDESGHVPPHLKKDPNHPGTWIAASDKPSPFPEKYVSNSKVERGPDTVPTDGGLAAIKNAAHQRHTSVQVDNAWHEPVKAAKKAYGAAPTHDNLLAYEEVKAGHAPFHEKMSEDSEAFGEAVARYHVIPEHYKGYRWENLSGPKNGNDQFDQVWSRTYANGVKKFVVIEAKGSHKLDLGKRELPTGFDARQGSKEYFNDVLSKMRERGLAGDANEMRLYREMRKALLQGNVEYVLVKAKSTAAGKYAGYAKWTFDIS
ncbi:hypothetical protein ACF09H_22580 [Streptomyces sp. NPDC014983]|uniref:hypothetical protein n=1 Tax=Streptomyces sp. NPDC014983 TaxID=3364933 RepID=UPI0037010E54